jgi:serine phosphatase RsbU (regulator of sigma subunit)
MFGEERLQDELRAAATGSAAAILETILAAVERFRGNRRALDDVSAVVIKAVAPTPARAGGAWS